MSPVRNSQTTTHAISAGLLGLLAATLLTTLASPALASRPQRVAAFNDCRLQPQFTQVFARGGIEASGSDYNGLTLAGRGATISNFLIAQPQNRTGLPASMRNCPALTVAGPIGLHSGRVEGMMGADSIVASRAHTGTRSSHDRRSFEPIDRFATWAADTSKHLSEQPSRRVLVQNNYMLIDRRFDRSEGIYHANPQDLAATRVIKIFGHAGQRTIINIYGRDIVLENMAFELEGGLRPQDVLLNFPTAVTLRMARAGSGSYGIPASILAPYAAADLRDLAITGQVFVGSLCGNGQINEGLFGHWIQETVNPTLPPAPHPCEGRPHACTAK